MLLLRSISQSCIGSLHDSLTVLTRRRCAFHRKEVGDQDVLFFIRTPDSEPLPVPVPSTPSPQSSTAIINTSNRQTSQTPNSNTSEKSSLTVGLSSQSSIFNSQSKTSRYGKDRTSLRNSLFFVAVLVG